MATDTNIFERASREKLRFTSNRGLLTVEDLWGMDLQSKSGFDLDSVAKTANSALKDAEETSFVATAPNPAKALHALRMDVIKHVIAVRLAENAAKLQLEARRAERSKLLEALANKNDEKLRGMTVEQIMAQLDAIDKAGV